MAKAMKWRLLYDWSDRKCWEVPTDRAVPFIKWYADSKMFCVNEIVHPKSWEDFKHLEKIGYFSNPKKIFFKTLKEAKKYVETNY